MKNFFEHDREVKYCDRLLEKNVKWQWFIDEIEKEFQGYNCNIETWQDFIDSYRNIKNVYDHLIKINAITGASYVFSKHWLEQINNISLLFNGVKTIEEIWTFSDCDFIKLFALIVFTTKLQNLDNTSQYIFSCLLYVQNNIFELYNLSKVQEQKNIIFQYLDDICLKDIHLLKQCLNNNLDSKVIPACINLLESNRSELLSVDAFNWNTLILPENATWEEHYIFDMVQTKIEDRGLVPLLEFGDVSTPDISLWTENILENLNNYFKNEIASFIIETVNYVLHKITPSDKTISWHFKLLINKLKKLDKQSSFHYIACSSLNIIQYLFVDKLIPNDLKAKYIKDYLQELQKFEDPKTINSLKLHSCIISSQQHTVLVDYNNNMANLVYEIVAAHKFIDYCKNEFVSEGMKNFHLDKLVTLFNNLINTDKNAVLISSLFLNFMKLLLRLLRNINIDKAKVKNMMINLQLLWKNNYYDICVGLMHSTGSSFTISNEEINDTNELYFTLPIEIAFSCMPISRKRILEAMAMHSEHPASLFARTITITKSFPIEHDKKLEHHDVDMAFTQIIENILKEKGYKLLNSIKPKILFQEIYSDYLSNVNLHMSFFNQVSRLYLDIKNLLPDYELVEIVDDKICLAHLVQLFPILENKIREFGMYFNIVPFKEKEDDFLHMKEPSSVLQQILIDVFNETGDLINVVDFFFIYQCMYNGNFLNIRNECVHGRKFIAGDSLTFGFKVTLLCLKLILNRLNQIKK